jgi:predicted outer membrane protein
MFSRKISLSVIAAAGIALGSAALAQQQPQQQQSQQQRQQQQADAQAAINRLMAKIAEDPKTAADKLFILTSALQTQSQIAMAREVGQKTQNEQVKKMAQQLAQNLEQAQQQLKQAAQQIGLDLPDALAQANVAEVQVVAALPADQIDQQYTAHVMAQNAQDLSRYQSAAQIAQDPQVRRCAQQQAQSAQQRSQDANTVARGMNMPSGGGEAQPAGARIRPQGGDQNR